MRQCVARVRGAASTAQLPRSRKGNSAASVAQQLVDRGLAARLLVDALSSIDQPHLALTLFAAPAALGGAAWAQGVLAGVWLTDVIGGAIGIAAYNRRLGRAARELGGAARPLGPAGP